MRNAPLPYRAYEHQQSVNDFWSCIFGNMSGTWSQASINKDMAVFIGKYVREIPATSSGTVTTYFIYSATTKSCWAFCCTKTAKTMYMENHGHIELCWTMMQGHQSLMLHWHWFSRWGREHVTFSFSYKGGQHFVYDCLQPFTLQITQDTRPTIVDAPFALIFKMGKGGYCGLFSLWKVPEMWLWLSETYR